MSGRGHAAPRWPRRRGRTRCVPASLPEGQRPRCQHSRVFRRSACKRGPQPASAGGSSGGGGRAPACQRPALRDRSAPRCVWPPPALRNQGFQGLADGQTPIVPRSPCPQASVHGARDSCTGRRRCCLKPRQEFSRLRSPLRRVQHHSSDPGRPCRRCPGAPAQQESFARCQRRPPS